MRAPQFGRFNKHSAGGPPARQEGAPLIVKLQPKLQRVGAPMPGLRSGKRQHNTHNRNILFARDPHCHWCGIETQIAPPETRTLSHFHATADHLHGVNSEKRDEIVLACHGCNIKRGYRNGETCRRPPDPERRANTLRLIEATIRGESNDLPQL